jgi:hypothetical protein
MFFNELDNESRQRLIDVQQRGDALRATRFELRRRFAGSMEWKERSGKDYLYRRVSKVEKTLGPRSTETEATYAAFTTGKAAMEEREAGLRRTLEGMARVNRAMGLGRVPRLVGRILRRLDEAGVLGEQVCVVGTNALFAYEARAGLRFDGGLLATSDVDIAPDARRNLDLAAKSMPDGLLGLLRKVDHSFAARTAGSFTAVNASGMMVDLITPETRDRMAATPRNKRRLGGLPSTAIIEDVDAVEVPRLEMIVDAPRFSVTAVAEDGLPVWIAAADPRWWAAHKLWLASEATRDPLKRQRDRDQGMSVAAMLANFWENPDVSDEALASIPAFTRQALRAAMRSGAADDRQPPEW